MGFLLISVFIVVLIFQKYSLTCDNLDDNKSAKTMNGYFYNKGTGVPAWNRLLPAYASTGCSFPLCNHIQSIYLVHTFPDQTVARQEPIFYSL
jgi:hypothetical protein